MSICSSDDLDEIRDRAADLAVENSHLRAAHADIVRKYEKMMQAPPDWTSFSGDDDPRLKYAREAWFGAAQISRAALGIRESAAHQGCCSVGFTGTPGDGGYIKPSNIWTVSWLPKGYGPSLEDRQVCVIFDSEGTLAEGKRDHPLVDDIARTVERFFRRRPDKITGTFENVSPQKKPGRHF